MLVIVLLSMCAWAGAAAHEGGLSSSGVGGLHKPLDALDAPLVSPAQPWVEAGNRWTPRRAVNITSGEALCPVWGPCVSS